MCLKEFTINGCTFKLRSLLPAELERLRAQYRRLESGHENPEEDVDELADLFAAAAGISREEFLCRVRFVNSDSLALALRDLAGLNSHAKRAADGTIKYSIGRREFQLKPLTKDEVERVRDLALRIHAHIVAQTPQLPAPLLEEVSEWFIRVAGFPFTELELSPGLGGTAWGAILTAAGFERFPDGRFNYLSGTGKS